MDAQLFIFAFAFAVSFGSIFVLKPLAAWANLVDRPGGRKVHQGIIPLVGGIAIYLSVLISALAFVEQAIFIRIFLLAGGLLVFMGSIDDRYDISARVRLLGQFLICAIFVYGLELRIDNIGNLFGMGDIHLGWLGYPFTIIALMSAINAFNMMDGIDGLVGGVALVIFLGLAVLFTAGGDMSIALVCWAFVGALTAFLIFNLVGQPNKTLTKIFMGDAGSMFIGLSIGVLVVYGSQNSIAKFSPTAVMWFVLFPITDMLTIMYRRIKRGRSPMSADRTHIHHILLRAGFNCKVTLIIMVCVQACLVLAGALLITHNLPDALSFVVIVLLVAAYQLLMKRSWRFIRWSKRRFA